MDIKITTRGEPISLEATSGGVNFESEVTHCLHFHTGNESTIEPVFPSDCKIHKDDNEKSTTVEIKQEPTNLEATSTESEMNHGPDVLIKKESTSLSSDTVFPSDYEVHRGNNEIGTKAEIKEEPGYVEIIFPKLESSSDTAFPSDYEAHRNDNEIGTKAEVKEDPGYVEITFPKLESSCDTAFPSDYEALRDDNEIDTKAEIKEVPGYVEITFPKLKSEPKDITLHFKPEDKASKVHQELTEPSRLDGEAVQNCGSEVINAELYDNLKLGENSRPCHAETSTTVTQGSDITKTFYQEDIVLHKCTLCGKNFNLASNLQAHILFHDDKGKIKCNFCEKTFTYASQLKGHTLQCQVTHELKEKHKCNLCEKSFTWASQLKKHNLQSHVTHELNGKYKCNLCEKSFTWASQLKKHNLQSHVTHELNGKYKCNLCEKTFTWASQLKKHNLQSHVTHELKGKHKCNLCEKSFSRVSQLKRHHLQFHATQEDKQNTQ